MTTPAALSLVRAQQNCGGGNDDFDVRDGDRSIRRRGKYDCTAEKKR
jgi:hypothetical protein